MKSNDVINLGILTDLDTLLDTRFGTLSYLSVRDNKNYLENLLHNYEFYTNRQSDNDIIKIAECNTFFDEYNKRNEKILPFSIANEVIYLIQYLLYKLSTQRPEVPYDYKPNITINVFKYNLSDNHLSIITKLIQEKLATKIIPIKYISVNPDKISYYDIKHSFYYIYMYHYNKMLDGISERIKETRSLYDRTVICPRLLLGDIDKVLAEFKNDTDKLFSTLKEVSEPFIGIDFLPIKFFCAILNTNTTDDSK